jgi:predicted transcriptional regulator
MNKPKPGIAPDADIGPVDENGQQIWSAEEEAAIARLHRDPAYWAGIERGLEDIRAGRMFDHEEALAKRAEQRRRWLAGRKN